jgi:excinuclease ABC subunit A
VTRWWSSSTTQSVLAAADWMIELGPGGGRDGGRVVAEAPPRELARKDTATGRVLHEAFARGH